MKLEDYGLAYRRGEHTHNLTPTLWSQLTHCIHSNNLQVHIFLHGEHCGWMFPRSRKIAYVDARSRLTHYFEPTLPLESFKPFLLRTK